MRRTFRTFAPIALLVAAAGCGAEKSKDEQASEFYDEKLHTADTKTCNDQGHLYDALDAECKTDVALATWACTRDGVAAQTDPAVDLSQLDSLLKDGYELHQCGETELQVYLVLVEKGKTEKQATLSIQRLGFLKKGAIAPQEKPTDTNTDPSTQQGGDLTLSVLDDQPIGAAGDCQKRTIQALHGGSGAAGKIRHSLGRSRTSAPRSTGRTSCRICASSWR